MEVLLQGLTQPEVPLKLLLFIDKRPQSREQIRQIRHHLQQLDGDHACSLDIIDISEQPYLVEHFRLVATPALIKIAPAPQQKLTGSDIIPQIEYWWPRWQNEVEAALELETKGQDPQNQAQCVQQSTHTSVAHSAELMQLSDEIFRLRQAKEELEAQLQFKDHIIAMLAHDLRNPLTAASIAVETLELGHHSAKKGMVTINSKLTAQLLNHAKNQIRAINRMITDILQAARGAGAELQIQPQGFKLQDLCAEVLANLGSKVLDKGQQVTSDLPQDLPLVYADPAQVRQVLVNLLDNAIKYTPEGGSIDLTALHRTTQKVQISIHDTGPGIPLENCDRIFEESFRLKRDHAKDGYGIGLALCQRIIRAHYGQIWVDSVPGEGSYFHFTLPVYR